ncbi:unnamed protein product [Brachionus calyciflorus]|uniref:Uncharacterized protein n=1 Tax=Brachionus calyciflorus TaxID=104777 RepID=A0A814EWV1_9BILA|nr:unnamed protein product [Brachionus calyciflorus]
MINFNEDSNESSSTFESKIGYEWVEIETELTEEEIEKFFTNSVPKVKVNQTNQKINCFSYDPFSPKHKLIQKYLDCTVEKCEVKYKWSLCHLKNQGRIFSFNEHNHPIEEYYDNSVGLPQEIKAIIRRLVQDQSRILCQTFKINFKMTYLMQDAQAA